MLICFERFKHSLIEVVLGCIDGAYEVFGREAEFVHKMKFNFVPKLEQFSARDYYQFLKVAAMFRFQRLNGELSDSFQTFFNARIGPKFAAITAFLKENDQMVADHRIVTNFYRDLENWLMIDLDEELGHIMTLLAEQVKVDVTRNIEREADTYNFVFYLFGPPVFFGSSEIDWIRFLSEKSRVVVTSDATLLFHPANQDVDVNSDVSVASTKDRLIRTTYSFLSQVHAFLENVHDPSVLDASGSAAA